MIEDLPVERILLLGDTHGDTSSTVLAVQRAKQNDCQVILQLGDFGFIGSGVDSFLHKTNRALIREGLHMFWIDGNHENHDRLDMWPLNKWGYHDTVPTAIFPDNAGTPCHLHHLPRGFRWTWGGIKFLALGGAYSIDKSSRQEHVSWWPQETITAGDVYRCGEAPCDVLVSHDVPWGVLDPYGPYRENKNLWLESNANRQALRAVVEATRPRLVVHGHTHWRKSTTMLLDDMGTLCQVEGLGCNPYWAGGGLSPDQWIVFELDTLRQVLGKSA